MALLAELEALDTDFRSRQLALQAAVSALVVRSFSQITPEDIINGAPSIDAWLERGVILTTALRDRSATESRSYYDSVRELMAPKAPPVSHAPLEPIPAEKIRTSLFVTGVVGARARLKEAAAQEEPPIVVREEDNARTLDDVDLLRKRQLELLKQGREAQRQVAIPTSADAAGAAAARHVANGGREQIQDTAKRDRIAIGYIRVISSKACYFCAMLASRGPVYKEDSFDASDLRFDGEGRHKVHDNCSCAMRPIFSRDGGEIPALNNSLEQKWRQLTDDLGGLDLNTWRQHYEGRAST